MNDDVLRAVRCDRRLHCSNCADAGAECRRLRLERPARSQKPTVIENSSPAHGAYKNEIDVQPKKRKLDHVVSAKETPKSPLSNCPVVTPDESTHHAEQARVIIQSELDGNERMNRERRVILKSALEFVNSMAQRTDSASDDSLALEGSHNDCPDIPESIEPSPELLYMLIRGTDSKIHSHTIIFTSGIVTNERAESTTSTEPSHNLHWPDHISNKALQKMASKFFTSNLTGQRFYQYCICIYMRAIFHTYHMPRLYNDSVMSEQFLKSKRLYAASALHALQNLNILNTPSLSLIQALISATFLMQYLGNMSQAWVLNSYAARLIAALNYHDVQSQNPFFVLFCNIIGEIDMDDYHLIQDITQSLSLFNASPYIAKLLKLLDTLQQLCEPLILTKQHLGPQAKVAPWYPATSDEQPATMAVSDASVALDASYMNSMAQTYPQSVQQDASGGVQPVADELMWHLFNSQPSLQWCESNVISLDPTVNY
ncbi:hypothetical protein PENSUB_12603 [Penicillium subrubescens]|uniref:Transcription factor domain-containing protein n=1 Tax=Penicillium subrubescens TaxID=1316194 RepID=A0A1Q5SX76_9EURO|nr:hypothetical protein PENSUB_12603 [Penicillium subrubescens]